MIYAIIDTNVILSALFTKSKSVATVKILDAVYSGKIKAVVHNEIIAEYAEVLLRPKFNFSKEKVMQTIKAFSCSGIFLDGLPADDFVKDADDVVFYEVALDAKSRFNDAYLVTGNTKHFPQKPIVITPAEMVKILEKS